MTKTIMTEEKSLNDCVYSLARQAEKSSDREGSAQLRLTQAALNLSNVMANIQMLDNYPD